jgi:hypothetical protein
MSPDRKSSKRLLAKPRRTPARAARPRKRRHWPLTEIGSELWWRQARKLGVERQRVEATLDIAHSEGRETIDPHHLRPGKSTAEQAVTYILVFKYVPTYASLMYVSHCWSKAGRSLKEWIVQQYAYSIDYGDDRQRKEALYSLWVDFFEVPPRAQLVFPRLLKAVRRRADLLAYSGPVPWAVKRDAYHKAAQDPALHAGLASGLAGSFFDVYGSVNAVEARDLFGAITVDDQEIREALQKIITQPIRWTVLAVVKVDERDDRWTKWLPAEGQHEPSFLMLLRSTGGRHGWWVPSSELLHEGRPIGRLRHYGFPFDREIPHKVYGTLEEETPGKAVLFRVEGSATSARSAIGSDIEAWPPGLGPGRRGHAAGLRGDGSRIPPVDPTR